MGSQPNSQADVVRIAGLAALLVTLIAVISSSASARESSTCTYVLYGALYRCAFPDGSVSVRNESNSVIRVKRVWGSTGLTLSRPSRVTLSDFAASAAVPGRCYPIGMCTVPPGASLAAFDDTIDPLTPPLTFALDLPRTISRNGALALVNMLESVLPTTPGRKLAVTAGHCASSAQSFADTPSDWEVVLRRGITVFGACKAVVRAWTSKPGQKATVAREATVWARRLAGGAWIDEMFNLFGKIARR